MRNIDRAHVALH
jgi:hypothetical protein